MISHQSPKDAVLLIEAASIDSKKIAIDLQKRIKAFLPDNVREVLVTLRNEDISDAFYHYTHGLQKHLGQCQRIAHGHRSRIEIKVNGERDAQLEAQWAERLRDSYIATESHIVNQCELNNIPHVSMAYTAQQGDFAITLPSAKIFTMPTESTVENIANYLAHIISKENKIDVRVKAYEGPDKGAFGEANYLSSSN